MNARPYDNILIEIQHLANSAKNVNSSQQKKQIIDQLNNIIVEHQVSDKTIVYANEQPDFASWNVACGSKWVNVLNDVGPSINAVNNPTFQNPNDHEKRMECCLAVIDTLKNSGISSIVLQEAPKEKNDNFYNNTGIIIGFPKPGNICLAATGNNMSLANNWKDPILTEFVRLTKKYNLQPGEVGLFTNHSGNYFIDLHLNYPGDQQALSQRQSFLAEIQILCQNNPQILAAGDTNMQNNAVNIAANVYGARGCDTTDIIIGANIINKAYFPPAQHPNALQQSANTNLNESKSIISQSTLFNPPKNVQMNVQMDLHDEEFIQRIRSKIADNLHVAQVTIGGQKITIAGTEIRVVDTIANIWNEITKKQVNVNKVKELIHEASLKEVVFLHRNQATVDLYQELNSIKNNAYPKITSPK